MIRAVVSGTGREFLLYPAKEWVFNNFILVLYIKFTISNLKSLELL